MIVPTDVIEMVPEPPKATVTPFIVMVLLVNELLGILVIADPGIVAEPPNATVVPFNVTELLVNDALGILVIADPGIDVEPPNATVVPFKVTELLVNEPLGIEVKPAPEPEKLVADSVPLLGLNDNFELDVFATRYAPLVDEPNIM